MNKKSRYSKSYTEQQFEILQKSPHSKRSLSMGVVSRDKIRKLGPRDIGRIKYKGTEYYEKNDGHWLDEKIHKHARTTSFNERKRRNPVEKRATVRQSSTEHYGWSDPEFLKQIQDELANDISNFLNTEKPMKPKDNRLEALKNTKIPKGIPVSEYHSPHSWTPIDYKYGMQRGGFLDEKLFFDASRVQIEGGLGKLIDCLSPKKQIILRKMESPSGYRTKIAFLKQLRDLVIKEMQRIEREDSLIAQIEKNRQILPLKKLHSKSNSKSKSKSSAKNRSKSAPPKKSTASVAQQKQKQKQKEKEKHSNDDCNKVIIENKKKVKFVLPLPLSETKEAAESEHESDFDFLDDEDFDLDLEMESEEVIDAKYQTLLKSKKSDIGQSQRKLMTMKSVNKLSDMIDELENKEKTETTVEMETN